MKELLEYIVKNILGPKSKFEITQEDDGNVVTLTVKTEEQDGGLIIGKSGRTVKAIRNILRIRATLEKKKVYLLVNPEE